MQKHVFIILFSLAVFGGAFAHAQNALPRTLSLGDSGEDVRFLQQLLNQHAESVLTPFGPGSPGLETPYFGALTEDAVKRYQAFHAAEILTPLGLTSPTGIAGLLTRTHLYAPEKTSVVPAAVSLSVVPTLSAPVASTGCLSDAEFSARYNSLDSVLSEFNNFSGANASDEDVKQFVTALLQKLCDPRL